MRALGAFVRLGRPHFLVGGFIAFGLGAAVARFEGHALALGPYVAAQGAVTAFHLMVHYANDYYDRAGDGFATPTLFSGGSGVLVLGQLPPAIALRAALACGAFGTALVASFALAGELALTVVTALIGLLAWAYSAPPMRLLARGLGELDTVVVVALLVPLAGYAAFAHTVTGRAVLATLPGACAMFAMMLCVELPDAAADARSGKRNLVVRWGSARAQILAAVAAAISVAVLAAVLGGSFGIAATVTAAAALLPALVAIALARSVSPALGVALFGAVGLAAIVAIASA